MHIRKKIYDVLALIAFLLAITVLICALKTPDDSLIFLGMMFLINGYILKKQ